MQSPGHSFAEPATSRRSVSGTGVVAPGACSSSSSEPFRRGQPVDVQLEDLGGVRDTDPSPVHRSWSIQTSSASPSTPGSCCTASLLPFPAPSGPIRLRVGPALTGVEHFDPTSACFPILLRGYSPGVGKTKKPTLPRRLLTISKGPAQACQPHAGPHRLEAILLYTSQSRSTPRPQDPCVFLTVTVVVVLVITVVTIQPVPAVITAASGLVLATGTAMRRILDHRPVTSL